MDVGVKRLVLICPSEEIPENIKRSLPDQVLDYGYDGVSESSCSSQVIVQVVLDADPILDLDDVACDVASL